RALLQTMPFAAVRDRLVAFGVGGEQAEAFWLAVRGNLDRLTDAARWWEVVSKGYRCDVSFAEADAAFLAEAFALLPGEPWNGATWKAWTSAVKDKTGRKGKALFRPLRLALTGLESGPELSDLLPLLGREETLARRP
ncbi:MAG: glutamate--tRNA ligase, partial [Nitratireductor sp.]